MNYQGRPNFTAYSAGSHPAGAVRPEAMRGDSRALTCRLTACEARVGTSSQSPDAPKLDFVFTVCDNAAKESLPHLAGPADDGALGRSRSGGG